jgi:hypothetical protein
MYILGFNCDEFGYFDISIQVFVAFGLWVSIESFDFTIFFFILHHIWGFLTIFEVACSLLLFSCDEFRFSNVSIQVLLVLVSEFLLNALI